MRRLVFFIVITSLGLCLGGCAGTWQEATYNNIRQNQVQACQEKGPTAAKEACLNRVLPDFKEYENNRKALLRKKKPTA